eukprot:1157597-Pelagomonas_calceolata.AAC.3
MSTLQERSRGAAVATALSTVPSTAAEVGEFILRRLCTTVDRAMRHCLPRYRTTAHLFDSLKSVRTCEKAGMVLHEERMYSPRSQEVKRLAFQTVAHTVVCNATLGPPNTPPTQTPPPAPPFAVQNVLEPDIAAAGLGPDKQAMQGALAELLGVSPRRQLVMCAC